MISLFFVQVASFGCYFISFYSSLRISKTSNRQILYRLSARIMRLSRLMHALQSSQQLNWSALDSGKIIHFATRSEEWKWASDGRTSRQRGRAHERKYLWKNKLWLNGKTSAPVSVRPKTNTQRNYWTRQVTLLGNWTQSHVKRLKK